MVREMIGELNSSHTRFSAKKSKAGASTDTAYLGAVPDFKELEETGRFRVAKVYANTPANNPESRVETGEYIIAIDGQKIGPGVNVPEMLNNKAGRRVELTVSASPDGKDARTVKIKPAEPHKKYPALYYDWIETCRGIVKERSKGRLTYLHIYAMGEHSLYRFKREIVSRAMDAEGVVIDVRFNSGGSTAVEVLTILMRKPWLVRTTRIEGLEVSENLWRSSALEKPSILLINENSVSNAEILAEGFKRLKIGKVVGVPTPGMVIGTGSYKLFDGSTVSLPSVGAFTLDGENLENVGRKPDIHVPISTADYISGRDPQLERAVDELLKELAGKK
jgi:tricorn protease